MVMSLKLVFQAAWCLQGFATVFYSVFSVVVYVYLGSTVMSPALLSLPPKWAKAAFGIGLGNFLVYFLSLPVHYSSSDSSLGPVLCTAILLLSSSSFDSSVIHATSTLTQSLDGRCGRSCAFSRWPLRLSSQRLCPFSAT